MKKLWISLIFITLACTFTACHKDNSSKEESGSTYDLYYANLFCANIMRSYYYWNDEVADKIDAWSSKADAAKQVEACRYEMDRWTEYTTDVEAFSGNVNKTNRSMGFDFIVSYLDAEKTRVGAVVTFIYNGSPASEMGLKRGDAIVALDQITLTADNYRSLLTQKIFQANFVQLDLLDGRSIQLDAREGYLNPVQTVKTLDVNGKKIGYLHFSGFTLVACKDLESAFRQFKEDGISELVLDLRYNGGGYMQTSTVLASMIAPLDVVQERNVFNKNLYNRVYSEHLEEIGTKTDVNFAPQFDMRANDLGTIDAAGVNPGISHLWVIVGPNTASASESLICGLKPYMDVTLVGQTTYGKFCGGNIIPAADWYDALGETDTKVNWQSGKRHTANCGIYVMTSVYADKNGLTLSMPSGIPADIAANDRPMDGFQLGDPSETMLATVLALSATKAPVETPAGETPAGEALPFHKPGFGLLIY